MFIMPVSVYSNSFQKNNNYAKQPMSVSFKAVPPQGERILIDSQNIVEFLMQRIAGLDKGKIDYAIDPVADKLVYAHFKSIAKYCRNLAKGVSHIEEAKPDIDSFLTARAKISDASIPVFDRGSYTRTFEPKTNNAVTVVDTAKNYVCEMTCKAKDASQWQEVVVTLPNKEKPTQRITFVPNTSIKYEVFGKDGLRTMYWLGEDFTMKAVKQIKKLANGVDQVIGDISLRKHPFTDQLFAAKSQSHPYISLMPKPKGDKG